MSTFIPPPEVAQRPATPEEIPRSAARLLARGMDNGWATQATYARGMGLGHKPVDSLAVWLSRDRLRLVGYWHDGKFRSAVFRMTGARGMFRLSSGQLTALVLA